jgi:hypothetical protein
VAEPTINHVRLMKRSRLEWTRRVGVLLAGALTLSALPAAAQQDSAASELHTVLRAFYFNLAHHDWQAIAADVLSAKILASRPVPERLIAPSASSIATCASIGSMVKQAVIRLEGDWAAVSISRCGIASAGVDEFRLIHFQRRWRFSYIALFVEPGIVSADR